MMIAGVYDFSNWKDEFIKHLSDNGCKPSTAKDYAGRIEKIINNEGVTVQEYLQELISGSKNIKREDMRAKIKQVTMLGRAH